MITGEVMGTVITSQPGRMSRFGPAWGGLFNPRPLSKLAKRGHLGPS